MKHIIKNQNTPEFEKWKQSGINVTWDTFSGDFKKEVQLSLLEEQGYICGYCGKRIHSQNMAIEHFIPRDLLSDELSKLMYNNFLGSCKGGNDESYIIEKKDIGDTEEKRFEILISILYKMYPNFEELKRKYVEEEIEKQKKRNQTSFHKESIPKEKELEKKFITIKIRELKKKNNHINFDKPLQEGKKLFVPMSPDDYHCDHSKGNVPLLLSPFHPSCETVFKFEDSGKFKVRKEYSDNKKNYDEFIKMAYIQDLITDLNAKPTDIEKFVHLEANKWRFASSDLFDKFNDFLQKYFEKVIGLNSPELIRSRKNTFEALQGLIDTFAAVNNDPLGIVQEQIEFNQTKQDTMIEGKSCKAFPEFSQAIVTYLTDSYL